MHNQDNKKGKHSMFGMIILCVAPLAIIFFVGPNVFSAGYFWPIVIGAFAVLHIYLMFRGHGMQGEDKSEGKKDIVEKESNPIVPVSDQSNPRKNHSCCH